VAITTQRVVFMGAKYTREWPLARLVRVEHFEERPWTGLEVTTRERMSGFTYRGLRPDFVRSRMTLAIAIQRGQQDKVAGELRQLLAQVEQRAASTDRPAHSPRTVGTPADRSVAAITESRPKRQKPLIAAAQAIEKGA
jgi:hypothetical protein